MVGISKIEYSYYPKDNCLLNLGNLPQDEQCKVIDAMSTERVLGRPFFDSDNNQTVIFAGKMIDRYGQVIVDVKFILNGFHHFSPRQIITGNSLQNLESFHFYQDSDYFL